LGIPRYY